MISPLNILTHSLTDLFHKSTSKVPCFDFIPAPFSCSFSNGDGSGGSEEKIGLQKGNACVKACIERKRKDDTINGVTVYQGNKRGCWCEKRMTSVKGSSVYKTCLLQKSAPGIHDRLVLFKMSCLLFLYIYESYTLYKAKRNNSLICLTGSNLQNFPKMANRTVFSSLFEFRR